MFDAVATALTVLALLALCLRWANKDEQTASPTDSGSTPAGLLRRHATPGRPARHTRRSAGCSRRSVNDLRL